MEGDRLVTVRFYGSGPESSVGDPPAVITRSQQAWARRSDLGGTETLDELAVVSEQKSRWRVRQPGLEGVNSTCDLVDDEGRVWDIEGCNRAARTAGDLVRPSTPRSNGVRR